MTYLIDNSTQKQLAARIDAAVAEVISELNNHGSEEGVTPVLGHALMRQSFRDGDLRVDFNYRQLNKITEEPQAGADGGFLVRVTNCEGTTQKAALFQAKLLRGVGPTRKLSISTNDAERLQKQATDMLALTEEAVAIFYTQSGIFVVDAEHYRSKSLSDTRHPLSQGHRLITLGTYLGQWLPRCTRGDRDSGLISRIEHLEGFHKGLTMDVITKRPSIRWKEDATAAQWRSQRPTGRK